MRHLMLLLVIVAVFTQPVHAQTTATDAQLAVAQAEEAFAAMEEAGFGTASPRDALSEAKKSFENGEYEKAVAKSGDVVSRMERAFEIRDFLWTLENRVAVAEANGLDAARTKEFMSAAVMAFSQENYDEAEEFISQAGHELDDVEAEFSIVMARYEAARSNVIGYARAHAVGIVVAIILLTIVSAVLALGGAIVATKRRISDLELEKDVLRDLIERTQRQYYQEASISKTVYDIKTKKFMARTREIEAEFPVLQTRLKSLEKILPLVHKVEEPTG